MTENFIKLNLIIIWYIWCDSSNERWAPQISNCLTDKDKRVRTAAIECLNQLGDDIVSDYAPMIAAQMHYEGDGAASWKVRNAACDVIVDMWVQCLPPHSFLPMECAFLFSYLRPPLLTSFRPFVLPPFSLLCFFLPFLLSFPSLPFPFPFPSNFRGSTITLLYEAGFEELLNDSDFAVRNTAAGAIRFLHPEEHDHDAIVPGRKNMMKK